MASLHHINLSTTPFSRASTLQSILVSKFLASKSSPTLAPPPPIAITSIFPPTYTLGRRERSISVSQRDHLCANGRAGVVSTQRGGQTTFHGPGQMTGYLLLDLQRHRLTPRCYIRMLEDSVIACLSHYGIRGYTTEDPGVWTSDTRKICAVGVHMRRNVTSFGIGLNVDTDLWWFDRIVACGLEGKEATSFVKEGVKGVGVEEVAGRWTRCVAERLGVEVVQAEGGDVLTEVEMGVWEKGVVEDGSERGVKS
ncbi:hypothetical protein BDD12DRAFT_741297 [Trichophaea hybrida]|nr:hypothetical protein BDD12DRAFT_741297 [Trichophaea hybrida]